MQVREELGRGGFGIVHRVVMPDGRVCARKTFALRDGAARSTAAGRLAETRFRREVRIQRGIVHPNVVPVLEEDLTAAPPWFTMPFATGTLRQRILADRRAYCATVAPLWDVLAGLEAMHTNGYVHRDLKPENVLLLGTEWAVSDFGLARIEAGDGDVRTGSGEGLGTRSYMSPEQYRRFHAASSPADIFAFGCILHDIFGAELRIPYQQCSVPGRLAAVVERCTAFAEGDRYPDVAALRMALLESLRPSGASPVSSVVEVRRARIHAHSDQWVASAWRRLTSWLTDTATAVERQHVLAVLDVAQLEHVRTADPRSWDRLARLTCGWLRELRAPGAAVADAGAARLRHFVLHGDPRVQTEAMIALLALAYHAHRPHVAWQWREAVRAPSCEQFGSQLARALDELGVSAALSLAHVDPMWVHATAIPPVLKATFDRLRGAVPKAG